MRFWWVNQNQTFKSEVSGGFLWSPKRRSDNGYNQFYENMREVAAGDVVFSFCDTYIKAIGVAKGAAETAPKPDFGSAGASWSQEGWLVPVEFRKLVNQIHPKEHISELMPHLPTKYSPLRPDGNGLQSVYLAGIPEPMAAILIKLIGTEYFEVLTQLRGSAEQPDVSTEHDLELIKRRSDISETTKDQLIKARRGQGIFKANVRLVESCCRVTRVSDQEHLRASHIKPWKDSSDDEKLNGSNGLLLAPHIDHLFDRGFVSFSNDGSILISPALQISVLLAWAISPQLNVGKFSLEQSEFLEYHREHVFKHKS